MAEMVTGQLYRVMLTGVCDLTGDTRKTEYLMVGASVGDIQSRFSYVVDVSEYSRWRLDYVTKEPERAHVLWTKVERSAPNPEDITIKREFGSQGFWQEILGHTPDRHKFEVVARTVLFAKNANQATKKLAERLNEGSDHVKIVVEELPTNDGFAKPKDMSVFPRATFVRG